MADAVGPGERRQTRPHETLDGTTATAAIGQPSKRGTAVIERFVEPPGMAGFLAF